MKSTKIVVLMFAGLVLSMVQYAVADDAIHVTPAGDVGFGTNTPTDKMHVKGGNFKVEQSAPHRTAALQLVT